MDESGHQCKNHRGWAWIMTNAQATYMKLDRSRGMKVLRQMMPTFPGTIVTDRYAAYNYYHPQKRQICWAHLLRDFERFAHSAHPHVSPWGYVLRKMGSKLCKAHQHFKKGTITEAVFTKHAAVLRLRICYCLEQLEQLEGAPHVHGMVRNILKVEPMMWKFLEDPCTIPLTNNLAERQIRHYVVYRKKSFFTWSARGDRFIERMFSLYLTWRQNGLNPYHQLLALSIT